MSQEQKQKQSIALETARTAGMTPKEVRSLEKYIESGIPGVSTIGDKQLEAMFKMYISGHTFNEISMKNFVRKDIVLFLAYKNDWAGKKQEYIENIIQSLNQQVELMALESSSFMMETARFLHNYFRERMSLYERTKDPSVIDATDWKLLDKYLKCIELMKGKNGGGSIPPVPQSIPNVSIHAADGSTVNVSAGNQNNVDHSQLLKFFADLERAKEKQQQTNRKENK